MDLERSLEQAIQQALRAVSPSIQLILRRGLPDALYEAYVFSLVLRAFQSLGARVLLQGMRGASGPFVFRGSPGRLHSSLHNYGYASCSYRGRELEVHVDVQFLGTSRVLHEIDVAVVDSDEAQRSRRDRQDPASRYTRCAFECKLYGGTLGTHLIRTFTGLLDDMGELIVAVFASNQASQTIARFCSAKRSRPCFADQLTPFDYEAENRFVGYTATSLRKWLG